MVDEYIFAIEQIEREFSHESAMEMYNFLELTPATEGFSLKEFFHKAVEALKKLITTVINFLKRKLNISKSPVRNYALEPVFIRTCGSTQQTFAKIMSMAVQGNMTSPFAIADDELDARITDEVEMWEKTKKEMFLKLMQCNENRYYKPMKLDPFFNPSPNNSHSIVNFLDNIKDLFERYGKFHQEAARQMHGDNVDSMRAGFFNNLVAKIARLTALIMTCFDMGFMDSREKYLTAQVSNVEAASYKE